MSQTWERPPESFGCYVAFRYSCGHTLLRDVTDIVIVRGITDDMLWLTESVDLDYPCESCWRTRPKSDVSEQNLSPEYKKSDFDVEHS